MVAAGKSASDAAKEIFSIISVSNKADQATNATSSQTFTNIIDKFTAAKQAIDSFAAAAKSGADTDAKVLEAAFSGGLDAVQSYYLSLVGAKDETGKVITQTEALNQTLEKLVANGNSNVEIGENQLELITQQNPLYANIINSTDTLTDAWTKIQLYTSGVAVDLTKIDGATAANLLKTLTALNSAATAMTTDTSLGSNNPLHSLAMMGEAAKEAYDKARKASDAATKNAQKNADAEIKAIDKKIEKINEEADARIRAIEDQAEKQDYLTEVQKEQLNYQQALMAGDMSRAAQSQLNIQSLTNERQKTLAVDAINDKREADLKKLEEAKAGVQERLAKLQEKAVKLQEEANRKAKEYADIQQLQQSIAATLGKAAATDDPDQLKALAKVLASDVSALSKLGKGGAAAAKSISAGVPVTGGMLEYGGKVTGGAPDWLSYLKTLVNNGDPTKNSVVEFAGQYFKDFGGNIDKFGQYVDKLLGIKTTVNIKYSSSDIDLAGGQVVTGYKDGKPVTTKLSKDEQFSPMANNDIWQEIVAKGGEVKPGTKIRLKDNKMYEISRLIKGVDGTEQIILKPTSYATGGSVKNFEWGGNVTGPGTATSDSIPAMLSNGEYVIKASAVDQYGKTFFDELNAQKLATGGPVYPSWKKPKYPYNSKNQPTGSPYGRYWGELERLYQQSPIGFDKNGKPIFNNAGKDPWGGVEIPGLPFKGKVGQFSDYWHQLAEQLRKSSSPGMGIDRSPDRYAGSGASMGGIGNGAYGFGPLMFAKGGSVQKFANGGMPNVFGMGMEWFGNTLFKSMNSVVKTALGFDATTSFGDKSNMEKLAMATFPFGIAGGTRAASALAPKLEALRLMKQGLHKSENPNLVNELLHPLKYKAQKEQTLGNFTHFSSNPGYQASNPRYGNNSYAPNLDIKAIKAILKSKGFASPSKMAEYGVENGSMYGIKFNHPAVQAAIKDGYIGTKLLINNPEAGQFAPFFTGIKKHPLGGIAPKRFHSGGPVGHRHGRNLPTTQVQSMAAPTGAKWTKLDGKKHYVFNKNGGFGLSVIDTKGMTLDYLNANYVDQGVYTESKSPNKNKSTNSSPYSYNSAVSTGLFQGFSVPWLEFLGVKGVHQTANKIFQGGKNKAMNSFYGSTPNNWDYASAALLPLNFIASGEKAAVSTVAKAPSLVSRLAKSGTKGVNYLGALGKKGISSAISKLGTFTAKSKFEKQYAQYASNPLDAAKDIVRGSQRDAMSIRMIEQFALLASKGLKAEDIYHTLPDGKLWIHPNVERFLPPGFERNGVNNLWNAAGHTIDLPEKEILAYYEKELIEHSKKVRAAKTYLSAPSSYLTRIAQMGKNATPFQQSLLGKVDKVKSIVPGIASKVKSFVSGQKLGLQFAKAQNLQYGDPAQKEMFDIFGGAATRSSGETIAESAQKVISRYDKDVASIELQKRIIQILQANRSLKFSDVVQSQEIIDLAAKAGTAPNYIQNLLGGISRYIDPGASPDLSYIKDFDKELLQLQNAKTGAEKYLSSPLSLIARFKESRLLAKKTQAAGFGKYSSGPILNAVVQSRLIPKPLKNLFEVYAGRTRSGRDNLGLPENMMHPLDVPIDHARAYGPGTYFARTPKFSEQIFKGFGDNVYKMKLAPKAFLQVLKSKGFIEEENIYKIIEDMGFDPKSLSGMAWDHPVIQKLIAEGYLGLKHKQAYTSWHTGLPGFNLQSTKKLASGIKNFSYQDMLETTLKTGAKAPLFSLGSYSLQRILEQISPELKANGGYIDGSRLNIPKFESGINIVPADMLAMLHKNEAVVPANMNPFNPNANNATMGGAVYNITNNINGADCDINELSDIVTRKTIESMKTISTINMKTVGQNRSLGSSLEVRA